MNLTLKRDPAHLYGVFGRMLDESGAQLFYTLEHAFPDGNGGFAAKLSPGVYQCRRGTHRLAHGGPFETFEVLGVPPFQGATVTGVLLHVGNYNRDSDGCVLLGKLFSPSWCILDSRDAFSEFMSLQDGLDAFTLTVS